MDTEFTISSPPHCALSSQAHFFSTHLGLLPEAGYPIKQSVHPKTYPIVCHLGCLFLGSPWGLKRDTPNSLGHRTIAGLGAEEGAWGIEALKDPEHRTVH